MTQRYSLRLSVLLWVGLVSISCTHAPSADSRIEEDAAPRSPSAAPPSALPLSAKRLTSPAQFTKGIEGPAVDRSGNLYAVNFSQNGRIGIVRDASLAVADGSAQANVFLTLPDEGIPNSIRFGPDGSMFIADYKKHRVYRLPAKKFPVGENDLPIPNEDLIEFFDALEAFKANGKFDLNKGLPMHQPNDMTIAADGTIYLSDPTWRKDKWGNIWQLQVKKGASGDLSAGEIEQVLPDFGVAKVDLPTVPIRQLELYTDPARLKAPNGIDLSPDGKKLYFGDSQHGNVYVADLDKGVAKNPRIFLRLKQETLDGIRTDIKGNVYVARTAMGEIHRFPPNYKISEDPKILSEPKPADRIKLNGKNPSNMAFGGPKGTTLFVTVVDCGCIERIEVPFSGREWSLK